VTQKSKLATARGQGGKVRTRRKSTSTPGQALPELVDVGIALKAAVHIDGINAANRLPPASALQLSRRPLTLPEPSSYPLRRSQPQAQRWWKRTACSCAQTRKPKASS